MHPADDKTIHLEHFLKLESAPAKRPKNRPNAGVSYIVPDFLVEMTDGCKRLVEIKASRRLAKPITQRKLEVARQFSAAEGWTFLTPKTLQPKAQGQRSGEAAKRHPG